MRIQEVTAKRFAVDGREFDSRREAEAHLERAQERINRESTFNALEFTVHEDHLKLMRRLNFGWGYVEFGAPAVDGKRPYGNSDVIDDIARVLEVELVEIDGEWEVPDKVRPYLLQRHLEMKNFLDILCHFGEIPSGSYRRRETYCEWEKV